MKTKDLIKALMETDSTGEAECCIGNSDILCLDKMPAWYDGPVQVTTRDDEGRVTAIKFSKTGDKVMIIPVRCTDILDSLYYVPPHMDYSELDPDLAAAYEASDEKTRLVWRTIHTNSETLCFCEWAVSRAAAIASSNHDIREYAEAFFKRADIDYDTPLPTEKTEAEKTGKCVYDSYINRRRLQWDITYNIEFDGMDWHITKK